MKTIIEMKENEGLESLLGKRVLLMCAGYFYEGKLVGLSETTCKLEDPSIVYSVGAWSNKDYLDIQKLNKPTWYVQIGLIESFGLSKND